MLDIGWPELFVIAAVALVVIGPKDLPKALHTVGKWVRKARMLTREFQNGLDDMIREAELEDIRKQAQAVRKLNLGREVERTIDPTGEVKDALAPPKLGKLDAPEPAAPKAAEPEEPARPAPAGEAVARKDGEGKGEDVETAPAAIPTAANANRA